MPQPSPEPARSEHELFEHADFLRALARALLRDEQRAEDVLQDTFVAALAHPPARGAALRAFLASIVRHLASNVVRGERRRDERERIAARPELDGSPAEVVERLETQRAVLELVLALREPYRTTLYRRYYEGLGPSAIARREGVPVKTVKARIARGLAELRARLDERSGGERGAWCAALGVIAWPSKGALVALPAGTFGGALMGKKLVVAALVLALSWIGWRTLGMRALAPRSDARGSIAADFERAPEPPPEIVAQPMAVEDTARAERQIGTRADEPTTGVLDVRLVWESDSKPAAFVGLRARSDGDPAPREQAALARTDADGRARFDALHAGEVRLWLDRGPSFEVALAAGEERLVELTIPTGIDVAGRVLDASGAPVAGAEIWIGSRHGIWSFASRATTSAADGSFQVRALEDETHVGARADGHQPSMMVLPQELVADARGVRAVELVLGPPGGALHGVVRDADGVPVADALVHAGPRGGGTTGASRLIAPTPVPVATDVEGRFELPGDLEPGVQPLHVMAHGHPVWSGEVELALGAKRFVEITLERSGRIVGRVVDVHGAPVEGARVVQAEEVGGGWFHHAFPPPMTKSDAEGRFELDWIPPGTQELNASDWRRPELGKARVRVVVAAGMTTECELALSLGATIEGRVVDEHGNGLAGWRVHAQPAHFGQIYPRDARTDASGSFVLANLGAAPFDLSVKAPGEFAIQPRAAQRGVEPGARGVLLVVEDVEQHSARFRARLVEGDGRVPQDVVLVLWPEGANGGNFVEYDRASGAIDHGPCPADRYVLKVQRGGRAVHSTEPFELAAGETTELGVIALGGLGAVAVTLSGIPRDELEGVRLSLDRPHESTVTLTLEGDSFQASDLTPGTWTLRAREGRQWLRDAELAVAAGETTRLALASAPARELEVGIRVEGAADWSRVHLEVRDLHGALVHSPWPQPRGNVVERGRFPGGLALPDGSYRVEAWTDGGQRASAALEVDAGLRAAPPLELVLR